MNIKSLLEIHTSGKQAHENIPNIRSHQGRSNQNQNEVPLHNHRDSYSQKGR